MNNTNAGCGGLPQESEKGHVKFYVKEPQPSAVGIQSNDPVSYLVKILTGLGKTPTDYLIIAPSTSPTTMLLGGSVLDPDDNKTWDWYEVWCPDAGDVTLPPAAEAGHVKVYPKEPEAVVVPPQPNTPVSYLVKVLTGLGKTAKDYLSTNPTVVPIGQAVVDPDDGKTWDWYTVWCPTGPPCLFLEDLFTDQMDEKD